MHVRVPVHEAAMRVDVAVERGSGGMAMGLGQMLGCHVPAPRSERAMRRTPSTISITATASSMERPTAGVTLQRRRMMAAPTAPMVTVWPSPQNAPTRAPAPKRRVRLTMVATATTWSASVAC